MNRAEKRSFDVVSVTPLSLRSDSRTLKQASSVHRLGYRSMVVEGLPSDFPSGALPFDVVASFEAPKPAVAPPAAEVAAPTTPDGAVDVQAPASDALAPEAQDDTLTRRLGWRVRAKNLWRKLTTSPDEITLEYIVEIIKTIYNVFYYICLNIVHRIMWMFNRTIWFIRGLINKLIYNSFNAFLRHVLKYINKYGYRQFWNLPKARVYYLHAPYQFPAVYARCVIHRAKFIYDAHDFYSGMDQDETIPTFWKEWIIPFETFVERLCIRKAASVVTVNDSLVRLMKEKFGCDAVVLRNSHDHRMEVVPERTIREVIGLDPQDFLVVCVGQWKRDTAIPAAIQAFSALPARFHLAFLGKGFPSYDALLAETGTRGRIHFVPAVQPGEVVPFIASADAGLLLYHAVSPSITNSLPNGFFQPLAAGLPILYPQLPEIGRLAESLNLGLPIDPRDSGSIRAQVERLGENADVRRQLIASVQEAGDVLSWERDEERLRAIVEALIGPSTQRN